MLSQFLSICQTKEGIRWYRKSQTKLQMNRHDQIFSSVADLGRWRERRRHKEQETHNFCWFLCGRLLNTALGRILSSLFLL